MKRELKSAEKTGNVLINLLISGRIIDCGELTISRSSLGSKGGLRHLIYLPLNRSYLWKLLNEKKVKVKFTLSFRKALLLKSLEDLIAHVQSLELGEIDGFMGYDIDKLYRSTNLLRLLLKSIFLYYTLTCSI
jgi:hypothetical protein